MFKYKRMLITISVIVIFVILMVIGRTPTLHEIKKKIQSTEAIQVEKAEIDSNKFTFYKKIEDKKKIQEITSFVSGLDTEEWMTTSDQSTTVSNKNRENYRLKFLDENNKTIAILQTDSSKPMKLKYKVHTYSLGIKSNEILRNMIEQSEI